MRYLPLAYLLLSAVALAIFVLGTPLVAGADADPMSVIFAYLLSLPWTLVLDLLGDVPMAVSVAVMLASMAINYTLLRALTRRWRTTVIPGGEAR